MRIVRWCVALLLSASAVACGGGDDDGCGAPLAITQGVWCVTITSSSSTCSASLDTTPWEVEFTQDGRTLSATSEFGAEYAGTICGEEATVTAGNGNVSMSAHLVYSDPSTGAATVEWSWQDPPCSGTDTAVASAGGCPP